MSCWPEAQAVPAKKRPPEVKAIMKQKVNVRMFSCYSVLKLTQNNYIKKSLKQTYVGSFRAINFLFMSKANIYKYKYFDLCHLYNINKYYNDICCVYMKE